MRQQEIGLDVPKRHTRDEMNLAEFPLTLLSTRSDPKIKTLEFRDQIRGKNGEVLNREWIITGADKFGLPTASDDELLIGLLKLSVDQGFADRKVYFTRYELLKALQWTTEGRSYQRLMKALDRLSGVRIKATNAFFDNATKTHSTVNFGIIDAYEINDGRDVMGRESGSSFFLWSEVLFKSFQVGYIKKLDLTFFLSLQSAISKRMFRYLDKHFWYKSRLIMKVFTFAHEKLGISRNYKFLSSIRQQLDPALDELVANGFLAGYEYQGRGENAEIVIISKSGAARSIQSANPIVDDSKSIDIVPQAGSSSLGTKISHDNDSQVYRRDQKLSLLTNALVDRGLKSSQAQKLLQDLSDTMLEKVSKIIEYFDDLCRSGSKFVSRSPVGFLYRAIENPSAFHLPGESKRQQEQLNFAAANARESKNEAKSAPRNQDNSFDLKAEYLVQRKTEAKRLRQEVEQKMLTKIRAEVEVALAKFKANISEKNFNEAVEHGIEERLLNLFAFPLYEDWIVTRKKIAV